MSRTLNTTVVHNGVVYAAGTSESDIDGADKITADVWGGEASASDSGPAGYSSLKVEELEAEVEKRNADRSEDDAIEVTGTGKDGKVVKKDLIAALEADDES